jgi:hypothetical protein
MSGGNDMSKKRKEYLRELSGMYGIELSTVVYLAELLGENEDYDGLVTTLEDYAGGWL